MQQIRYRPIEKKDYPVVGEIINQAFGLFRYVSNEAMLKTFKMQYVYSCLSEATYTCAAELDGEVVGVIMGQAKRRYRVLRHLPYAVKMLCCDRKIKRIGQRSNENMKDFENLHTVYHRFSQKHKGEFDGVLTLFAVKEDCRGFGVGTELLSGLRQYLQDQHVKRIYLYTDTTCTYDFYEHQGFERLEAEPLTVTREGRPFQMDVFLYGCSMTG